MLRFAANLTMLFTEHPPQDRIGAAAAARFGLVEELFPYDRPAERIRASLATHGCRMVLINAPVGDFAAGDRGHAAVAGGQDRFRRSVEQALETARILDAGIIHLMSGRASGPAAFDLYVDNLRWAAAQDRGRSFTIEPINRWDCPGYFLDDFDGAARVLRAVEAPNLHLQFDAYHAHRITGDVAGCWRRHGALARHIQIAGFPGRHEPAGGEIDFDGFFRSLQQDGYSGAISAEYHPKGGTEAGLDWLRRYAGASAPTPASSTAAQLPR